MDLKILFVGVIKKDVERLESLFDRLNVTYTSIENAEESLDFLRANQDVRILVLNTSCLRAIGTANYLEVLVMDDSIKLPIVLEYSQQERTVDVSDNGVIVETDEHITSLSKDNIEGYLRKYASIYNENKPKDVKFFDIDK